VRKKPPQSQPW